eukprot:g811.t1
MSFSRAGIARRAKGGQQRNQLVRAKKKKIVKNARMKSKENDGIAVTVSRADAKDVAKKQPPLPSSPQISLPFEPIRNFQHDHNAPRAAFKAKAVYSPRILETSSSASHGTEKQVWRKSTRIMAKQSTENAASQAMRLRQKANHAKRSKDEQLRTFQKRLQRRVTDRVKNERQAVEKRRGEWAKLESSALRTAKEVAQEVSSGNEFPQATFGYGRQLRSNVPLKAHIEDVSRSVTSARAAMLAHAIQNVPASTDASAAIALEETVDDGHDEENAERKAGVVEQHAGSPAATSMTFRRGASPGEVDRRSASNLVAVVRKAEMEAQREAARERNQQRRAAQRRARREAELLKHRQQQEKEIDDLRLANEEARAEDAAAEAQAKLAKSTGAEEQALQAQRQRDTAVRYINALRQRLLLRLKEQDMELPPLCSCFQGEMTGSASNLPMWEYCANNCQFFKNPQDVQKIVGDLMRSVKYSLA